MTRFLANEALWQEIEARVREAKRVRVAVAYLGRGGATLLPLKRGDRLVVDLSINAVHQGVTNPTEIRTLVRRGVEVFSRGSLHAKFVLADRTLIASSANVSHHSKTVLDEAGLMTTDASAVRRAADFFEQLCTEPVGDEYLKRCIAEYRPPTFKAAGDARQPRGKVTRRVVEAKLWFVGALESLDLTDQARDSIARVERRHEKRLKQPERTTVSWIRYSRVPKFLAQLCLGDWVVDCMKDGPGRYVGPPKQVLGLNEWVSSRDKRYTLLLLESPIDGESMTLTRFRKRISRIQPELDRPNPRTKAIVNQSVADDILRLWTPTGRCSRR